MFWDAGGKLPVHGFEAWRYIQGSAGSAAVAA